MTGFNFEATNFPGFFIRHRNFLGELTKINEGPIGDFAFTLATRDAHRRIVSFASVNFQGRLLRHSNFRIRLDGPPGPGDQAALFLRDSSFFEEPGLADPTALSFRSVNFPDRYLRHRNFDLFVESRDSPNLAADATFKMRPASVAIDGGTALVAASD